ncbi:Benzyl alcohol O-benzoyltransferase [Hibiscus syriacus]|uniref:Benzyl alcohol O-benzoyltransferase n=1 Tax=Hibiscus syriacus TaxID=106335 RepID=A0A6A3CZ95_HIBSY|nr:benzyl alcohol O-benzoyltransferase-like [Hibiscus syriacus]KAE8733694.1 Benzyl alcohol O-benzoyltransferase [Hibiscus syriacus]
MATPSDIPLTFTVRTCKPELVAPAKPTPLEQKPLSDIDDQASFRFQIPLIHFYRPQPSMEGKNPAEVIKAALAQTLVLYYPFAGRLREGANGKLIVDCNGEGVMFIKADADVTLQHFGDELQPPFPCFDQLLFDVPGSEGMINCPLLLIQVTRLKCGGFIFATRLNHVMTDGPGLKQSMFAVTAMARGEATQLIQPVWERHLLDAPDPPRVTFKHHEYDEVEVSTATTWPSDNLVQRSFFFGHAEISLLRRLLPPHLRRCTKFELLTAFLWRCRTLAINIDPNEEVRMMCVVNARFKFNPPILPPGYYGNAFVLSAAITRVKKLRENPLGYAVELVKQAKARLTEEYMKSVAALMVIRGKQLLFPNVMGSYIISDLTHSGLEDVDFGWGKPVFGGVAKAVGVISFFTPRKTKKGEAGTLVPICLPAPAMERFAEELDNMLKQQPMEDKKSQSKLTSAL